MSQAAPPPSGPDANTKHTSKSNVIIACIGAASTLTGILVTSARADDDNEQSDPPRIEITGFEWKRNSEGRAEGRYELTGEAENLSIGQMIWSYNQRVDDAGEVEIVFPEYGPCPVDADGTFVCDLGWAGRPEEDVNITYRLYAAVVSDEDAYTASEIRADLNGTSAFASVDAIPRVDGEDTLDFTEEVRPPS